MRKTTIAVALIMLLMVPSALSAYTPTPVVLDGNYRFLVELEEHFDDENPYALTSTSHANFTSNLLLACPDAKTVFEYSFCASAYSIECGPEDAKRLSGLPGVRSVSLVQYVYPHLYEAVETTGAVDVWELRDGLNREINGDGVLVGILDTGINYSHYALGKVFSDTAKVVKGYDFADLDDDPYPRSGHGGWHGTHVAGIVAADGDAGVATGKSMPSGIAPDAKLGAYKIFSDDGGGAPTDRTMMALEQAFMDGCDVVNMSIGSDYTWADTPYCRFIDRMVKQGMVVVASAGNDGDMSREELPFQIGSPGGADLAICVAAMNDAEVTLFEYGDEDIINPSPMTYSVPVEEELSGELVYCELAQPEEVEDLDLDGKIALVKRGDLSFHDKAKNVEDKGAIACVVFNNKPGHFGGTLGTDDISIPVFSVSAEIGAELMDYVGDVCRFYKDKQLGLMADFSSAGPTNDYRLKPDVSAPGYQVLSTVGEESYIKMNGTSMASPVVAGVAALVKQAHPDWSSFDIRSAVINYAIPQKDRKGNYHPILSQGTGRVHAPSSVNAPALFFPTSLSLGWVEEPRTEMLSIKNVTEKDMEFRVTVEPENGSSRTLDNITIKAGETYFFNTELGEDTGNEENAGYIVFRSGDHTARVGYLYYFGQEPYLEDVSHIETIVPAFSPNDDGKKDEFRGRISFNKLKAGIQWSLLDEDKELVRILWYSYGFQSGGMWDFNIKGKIDDMDLPEGKYYVVFHEIDFDKDPLIESNWDEVGEFEMYLTRTPPVVEVDEFDEIIYNLDEPYTITGRIVDMLLGSENLGSEGESVGLFTDSPMPTPVEIDDDGEFEIELNLKPGTNKIFIQAINEADLESFTAISIQSLSKTEFIISDKTARIANDKTEFELRTFSGDTHYIKATELPELVNEMLVEIDGKDIFISLGESTIKMKLDMPFLIVDGVADFCSPPVEVDGSDLYLPLVDILSAFGARMDGEDSSLWSLVWVPKAE
ncbi:MAG TPA: S8 family serine peptidase [Caldisericia bacterium]|nr:S8 family serine peptidase [Caldisericia bacterium]HPF49245.1 S8 family serine peptidase [Caldisericia bacterium]HPI84075.1 S8 family serine peptidase [Caldisericia bacterium]HPQ93333.1 S8 family serine peptidase [Caldisericia bacterium]HRV75285.1 S8 family serine peptidase [Caldisericia bacterium]